MDHLSTRISPKSPGFTEHQKGLRLVSHRALDIKGERYWGLRGVNPDQIDVKGRDWMEEKRKKKRRGSRFTLRQFERKAERKRDHVKRVEERYMATQFEQVRARVINKIKRICPTLSREEIEDRIDQVSYHVVDPSVLGTSYGDIDLQRGVVRLAVKSNRVMNTTLAHEMTHALMGRLVTCQRGNYRSTHWIQGHDLCEGIATDGELQIMGSDHDKIRVYQRELDVVRSWLSDISREELYLWAMTDIEPNDVVFGYSNVQGEMIDRLICSSFRNPMM
jgi:hypothetical protein